MSQSQSGDRSEHESALRQNQLILECAGEGIYGLNREGLTTFVNPAAERILGWPADELIGKAQHALIHHSTADGEPYRAADCPIYAAFTDGRVHHVDSEVFWKRDGSSIPVEYVSTPIVNEDGELEGAVVTFRDITERKRAEAELRDALVEIERLTEQLQAENQYLRQEIRGEHNFGEMIGSSTSLERAKGQIEQVAVTEATVLILGETGVGKELFARAIHDLSPRSTRTLVKVNCAALPSTLIESELFGHEKGAFTGAHSQRKGRFELADGGTIFLDEIGELPLELQAKLLRVIQEGEFERLGGSRTIATDIRIVAATNRDLHAMMQGGEFRDDLYYRLNVFPVRVPPLRERKDDIEELASTFTLKFAKSLGKAIGPPLAEDLAALTKYDWPGNVRELENVIERAVILSTDSQLRVRDALDVLPGQSQSVAGTGAKTLEEVEIDHILGILRQCDWRIGGEEGAAMILGLHPNTLRSRVKKLGLKEG